MSSIRPWSSHPSAQWSSYLHNIAQYIKTNVIHTLADILMPCIIKVGLNSDFNSTLFPIPLQILNKFESNKISRDLCKQIGFERMDALTPCDERYYALILSSTDRWVSKEPFFVTFNHLFVLDFEKIGRFEASHMTAEDTHLKDTTPCDVSKLTKTLTSCWPWY